MGRGEGEVSDHIERDMTMQRRTRRQWAASLVLAIMATLLVALPANAGVGWCRADPIVQLGNDEYQVIVSIPESNVPQVVGSLDFIIISPRWMSQELLFVDAGFNNFGETVLFKQTYYWNHVFVLTMPYVGQPFPVLVEIYKNGTLVKSATGTSNLVMVTVAAD